MAKYADLSAAQADGVVHYWPMAETSGAAVADAVGTWPGVVNPNTTLTTAEIDATVVATPGGVGRDVSANWPGPNAGGTNRFTPFRLDQLATPPSPLSAFTLRFRYFHRSYIWQDDANFGYFSLVFLGATGAGRAGVYVEVYQDGINNSVYWSAGGNSSGSTTIASPFAEGQWHDVVITGDATGTELWVNNSLVSTITGSSTYSIYTTDAAGTNPIYGFIGSYRDSTFTSYYQDKSTVDGILQDAAIWSRKLTSTEIGQLNAAGTAEPLVAPEQNSVSIPVEISVLETGAVSVPLAIAVRDAFRLPMSVTVEPATQTGPFALPVKVEVAQPTGLALPLSVTVYDASQYPGHGGTLASSTFAVSVIIGGEDYTDRLIGTIEVDAEEGAARTASLTVVARDGVFEPDTWINLPVTVDYIQGGVSFRIFTGIVDLPNLAIDDESITLSCTDNLQGRFEAKSRQQVESLFDGTGAQWSAAVFGQYETSEQFAEDLLSTVPLSADLDRNGQLVFGPWYSAGHDFQFLDSEVSPESVEAEWGSRRDIITQVAIEVDYTYQYFRERKHRYVWDYPRSFGDYLEQNTSLPTSAMIEEAATVDGWSILGAIEYERLPESGVQYLPSGGSTNWVISDEVRASLTLAADFTIRKRWVQDVRETYTITVQSQPNIARFGLLQDELRVSLDTSIDDTGFDAFEMEPPSEPVTIGSDTTWPSAAPDRIEAAIQTAVAAAQVKMLDSVRQNGVSFSTLIQPELERYHFLSLVSDKVTAQGKCRRVRHVIDFESGSATSDIELAVMRAEVSAAGTLSLAGLDYTEEALPTTTVLGSAIQNNEGTVEAPADDFQGYVGNYIFAQLPVAMENPFEERFAIRTPDLAENSRDAIEYAESATVEAPIYNQTLTVTL